MRCPASTSSRRSLLAARARHMRREPTFEECLLWQAIRGRRLGAAFRRQVPIAGRYIADFVAPAEKLVVEVDGKSHVPSAKADARRNAALERLGYRVLRLEAASVVRDLAGAVERIMAALAAASEGKQRPSGQRITAALNAVAGDRS